MSKSQKQCSSIASVSAPVLLLRLRTVAKDYKAVKRQWIEREELTQRFYERFKVCPDITAPTYSADGKDYPAQVFSGPDGRKKLKSEYDCALIEMRHLALGEDPPYAYEFDQSGKELPTSNEFLKAKFKSLEDAKTDLAIEREERLHFIFGEAANDPDFADNAGDAPEDGDGPIFDDERLVCRRIGKILGGQVQSPTCLLIKAHLLELFAIAGDRREPARYPEYVSDEAIQLGAMRIAAALVADSPHTVEVEALIGEIRESIICHDGGNY